MRVPQTPRLRRSTALLVLVLAAAAPVGCSSAPTATPTALPTEPPPTPTIVTRVPPTSTPTPTPDPMGPVEPEEIAGVVVPRAAELVDFSPAEGGSDARADYALPGIDEETLRAWFLEHMPDAGWEDVEDRDGALVFSHASQLSPHTETGEEPAPRTVLVLFGVIPDADFSLLAEPAGDNTESAGDGTEPAADATQPAGDDDSDAADDDSESAP